jgi:lysophospholipase L1-like esterase
MKARLFALLSALALLILAPMPASASTTQGRGYLALGDSVAFGFKPDPATWPNINNFTGYPEIVAQSLNTTDVNASCPGETSGGFISLTNGADYKCLGFRAHFPLHVSYSTSQLDFAISYLRAHPEVKLVTMDIGANDVFKLAVACRGTTTACFSNGLPGVLAGIGANLRFIYGQIRNVAHYHHALVTLTYYSLSYDVATATGTKLLNRPINDATLAFGGIVASGFDAFEGPALNAGGSSCAAGLLLPPFPPDPSPCDVHPTPKGRDLLAGAVTTAIAQSCPAESFRGCLDRNED